MMTSTEELKALGIKDDELSNHASDLYVVKNDISTRWLSTYRFKQNVKTFPDSNGQVWYDIPFGRFEEWAAVKKS